MAFSSWKSLVGDQFNTLAGQLADSFRRFGRFDKYRFVEDSSPSALRRALKLS
jgi:hypothetical protein